MRLAKFSRESSPQRAAALFANAMVRATHDDRVSTGSERTPEILKAMTIGDMHNHSRHQARHSRTMTTVLSR
jgi:LDH2 family malate/lactate/ureidoglycolate dehydrogenase